MLTVISPAKRLNETTLDLPLTQPIFDGQARQLARIAKRLSAADLSDLMDISADLGRLNFDRFQNFGKSDARFAAAFMFDGDTYAGLEVGSLGPDALRWASGHLRILSGLYGLLRPLDGVQPHRLEMGTRLENPAGPNLYAFWGNKIARALNDLGRDTGATYLLNCASTEYFSAVDQKALKLPIITPVFLEERDGTGKIISFWAKRARGSFARFAAEGHITDPADLRGFDLGGYRFRADLSQGGRMVFTRPYQAAITSKAA